ncbi:MAG: hypothetical protein A3F68_00470 [Acidobacteria bacterium RIFCSPLOWO2_12_FULL_54_10]|nr:MAG: hypothetical protein A3F68_00470 [Acidobacteria bacterium RIFCSPLOWO2_12_FULL_54_10]
MLCVAIQIRPDQTFTYKEHGDIQRGSVDGSWSFIDNKTLHAVSYSQPKPEVKESVTPDQLDFKIIVVDQIGGSIPGATINMVDETLETRWETNYDGLVIIPRCTEFEVSFLSKLLRYRPINNDSNTFVVSLPVDVLTVDENWLIKGNYLYSVAPDGTVDMSSGLKKLGRAEEQNIFP